MRPPDLPGITTATRVRCGHLQLDVEADGTMIQSVTGATRWDRTAEGRQWAESENPACGAELRRV